VTFLLFALTVYALCFLAADARIFGADTTAWIQIRENPDQEPLPSDLEWLDKAGFIRIRQPLLRVRFLREHLSCYFCMGVWAGPVAHTLWWHFYNLPGVGLYVQDSYFLQHPHTGAGWALGLGLAFLLGSTSGFLLNTVVSALEGE
jgi:hypothetical protein